MFNRFNQHRERRKKGEFRSKLEGEISQALQQQGLDIDYEKDRFDFYLKRFYTPDFRVKGKAFDFWIGQGLLAVTRTVKDARCHSTAPNTADLYRTANTAQADQQDEHHVLLHVVRAIRHRLVSHPHPR